MTQIKTVGFIGIGVMGRSMAEHLMDAGYEVLVYTRTKAKADALIQKGASWKPEVKEIAQHADAVITMVGYPSDVEEIYLGEEGLVAHATPGTYLIDMTTSKPQLAKEIEVKAKEKGCLHQMHQFLAETQVQKCNACHYDWRRKISL